MSSESPRKPARSYDKGERRYKHVGKTDRPEIQFIPGNPRMWIGKCPASLTADDRTRLVNEAIPASNGDRELSAPRKIYTVHEGAIYEGQTSDRGKTYHGYPYRGKLAGRLLIALKEIAVAKECVKEFDSWVKQHIEEHGAWPRKPST